MEKGPNWQTVCAALGVFLGVGSAVAAHFHGIEKANQYTDQKIEAAKTEMIPMLRDVQIRMQKVEIDTAVIRERITKENPRRDAGPMASVRQ